MLKFDLVKPCAGQHQSDFHFQGECDAFSICIIFGDSGSGKTTLIRALSGLDKRFSGVIDFKKQKWQDAHSILATEKRNIGVVFQEPRLFPHLDVLENLKLACKKAEGELFTIRELAQKLDFSALLHKKTYQLSGGQKQRIAIARAILCNPQLLIMDEPLSSLDHHSRQLLLPFIKDISKVIPILYITHAMAEAFYLGDKMMLINQGKIEAFGSPEALFLNPDLSLVKHAHSGLLLQVEALVYDQQYALLRGQVDGQTVLLTADSVPEQQKVQIKVESKDVIIATERLINSSLQNCLRVTIVSIKPLLKGSVLLTLSTGKQKLLAKITCKSLHELDLQVGQSLFAYIKTLSILDDLS